MTRVGRALYKVDADSTDAVKDINKVGEAFDKADKKAGSLGTAFDNLLTKDISGKAYLGGVAAAGAAIFGLARSTAEFAKNEQKLALQRGLTAKETRAASMWAESMGFSIEEVGELIEKQPEIFNSWIAKVSESNAEIEQGWQDSQEFTQSMAELGAEMRELGEHVLPVVSQAIRSIVDAVDSIPDWLVRTVTNAITVALNPVDTGTGIFHGARAELYTALGSDAAAQSARALSIRDLSAAGHRPLIVNNVTELDGQVLARSENAINEGR